MVHVGGLPIHSIYGYVLVNYEFGYIPSTVLAKIRIPSGGGHPQALRLSADSRGLRNPICGPVMVNMYF